jgi:indolepyruvate decarboxylase
MTDRLHDTVSVAEYLAIRLRQLGVDHLFGVPGDFNLLLLEALEEADGPAWIGTANELGAAYAADGYARERGFGAVLTTYGVGELSAINGIAGSFSEQVPVLQITGSPASTAAREGRLLHHTLLDGDFGHFERAYAEVTVAGTTLGSGEGDGSARGLGAGAQIDAVLEAMLDAHRPGYLSIPEDLVHEPVAAAPLQRPLAPRPSDPRAVAALARRLEERLGAARGVAILVGAGAQRVGAAGALVGVAEAAGLPVATLSDAVGLIDADHPLARGVYAGALGDDAAREAIESADLVLAVGAVFSDLLTGGFSTAIEPHAIVHVDVASTRIGDERFAVALPDALALLHHLTSPADEAFGDLSATTALRSPHAPEGREPEPEGREPEPEGREPEPDEDPRGPLTQEQLWRRFAAALPAGHTIVTDVGTAFFGIVGETLPPDTALHSQPLWSAIGYALPAGLGTALAQPDRRTIVLTGDGAAQMTVQELGTMLRHGVHPIVLLVDNDGYTIERAIRGPEAAYNDIARWDWPLLVRGLGGDAERVRLLDATTASELDAALRVAHATSDRLVFLRVRTDRQDLPRTLRDFSGRVARRAVPS